MAAHVSHRLPDLDLAVIDIPSGQTLEPCELALDSDMIHESHLATLLTLSSSVSPVRLEQTVRPDLFVGVTGRVALAFSCPCAPGFSGSPLIGEAGEVFGILQSIQIFGSRDPLGAPVIVGHALTYRDLVAAKLGLEQPDQPVGIWSLRSGSRWSTLESPESTLDLLLRVNEDEGWRVLRVGEYGSLAQWILAQPHTPAAPLLGSDTPADRALEFTRLEIQSTSELHCDTRAADLTLADLVQRNLDPALLASSRGAPEHYGRVRILSVSRCHPWFKAGARAGDHVFQVKTPSGESVVEPDSDTVQQSCAGACTLILWHPTPAGFRQISLEGRRLG